MAAARFRSYRNLRGTGNPTRRYGLRYSPTHDATSLALWPSGPLALWPSGPLALWPSGPLALWPSGPLALWPSGPLALWIITPLSSYTLANPKASIMVRCNLLTGHGRLKQKA